MTSATSTPTDDPTKSAAAEKSGSTAAPVRIDRWLWAARFFRTRSAAKAAIEGGKVHADGARVKPAKSVDVGQVLTIRRGASEVTVIVDALSDKRGGAPDAQRLYTETSDSIEAREQAASRRRMERAGLTVPSTRPTKKGRREIRRLKAQGEGSPDADSG